MVKSINVYKIGRIGKPHGVKGEMNFMFTDDVFDRTDSDYLIIETEGLLVPFFIEEYRFRSDETALLKLCDIDTQERAQQFTNCDVYFERDKADNADGELTWAQIIGFSLVNDSNGTTVGTIAAVDDSTINTLFEVVTPDGRRILVPAPDDLITEVRADEKIISLQIPDGLLAL